MLRKLFGIYRAALQDVFSEPAKPLIWLLVSATFCFCSVFIWIAIADGTGKVGELSLSSIIFHYFFLLVFWYIIGGMFSMIMEKEIHEGRLSQELLKPVFPFAKHILWEQGWKTFNVVVVIPILVCFILVFKNYLNFEISGTALLYGIPSIILGIPLFILIDFCLGCLTFWTGQIEGLYNFLWPIRNLFGGWLVPIALLPNLLHKIAIILPFRYIFNFPVELIQNQLRPNEIALGYIIAVAWTLIFFLLARKLYKAGLKKYEAFGN